MLLTLLQLNLAGGEVPPPPSPAPVATVAGGGMMTGRSSGRFVRVDDGQARRLSAQDATAYARTDRPLLSQRRNVALEVTDAVATAQCDCVVLGKDDLEQIRQLMKLLHAKPTKATQRQPVRPANDVARIWAMIDELESLKKTERRDRKKSR